MANVLYLKKMGMDDEDLKGDIKNHRVRVVKNIDILYNGKKYNMFFEFMQGIRYNYRTKNKRTGKPLKKPVREVINSNGVFIDTQFTKKEKFGDREYNASYSLLPLEKEFVKDNYSFTKKDVLNIVNRYKIGDKFTSIEFV